MIRLLGINIQSYIRDTKPYLTAKQIQQMHADGFTIGAHGLSHRKLGFVPEMDVESEIVGSCRAIRDITGQALVPFSFPQSAGNVDRSQLRDILEQHSHSPL